MIARVVGVDPGLARTGIGELTYDGHRCTTLVARTEASHPPANATDDQTADRITRMIRAVVPAGVAVAGEDGVLRHAPPSDLVMVVMEGPALHAKDQHADRNLGYWWALRRLLRSRRIPVARANPAHLKVWAADHGRATDAAMKLALDRMWPGARTTDDHQVDACLLALAGAQRLGWFTGGAPLRQAEALARMSWPALPEHRLVPAVTT